jgi:hypothetical protein
VVIYDEWMIQCTMISLCRYGVGKELERGEGLMNMIVCGMYVNVCSIVWGMYVCIVNDGVDR